MKPGRPHSRRVRWLDAERAGDDVQAEAALAVLFEELPSFAPSAGFAERVMMQLRPRWSDRWVAHWGVQAAAVLCLLQVALVVGAGSVTALALRGNLSLEAVVIGLTGLGVSALRLFAGTLDVLGVVARPVEGLASALAGPPGLTVAVICFVLSALALYGMIRTISTDRRWIDVPPRL